MNQIQRKKSKSHHYIKGMIDTRGIVTNRIDQQSNGLMSYRKIQSMNEDFNSQISTKLSLPSLAGLMTQGKHNEMKSTFNYQTANITNQ